MSGSPVPDTPRSEDVYTSLFVVQGVERVEVREK